MCDHCGCSQPSQARDAAHGHGHDHAHDHDHQHDHEHGTQVDVRQSVLAFNDRLAEQNRGFLRARALPAVNLLSGPGAGKTTLIERTARDLAGDTVLGVIVGDLQTQNDADRIEASGARAVQITTGEVCHLDAHMVQHAIEELALDGLNALLIENVGNLVCPASFDLGESARVVLMSVTEGEDKPIKYPVIFHKADLVVISKIDLAEAVEFDRDKAVANIGRVAPDAEIVELSAKTGAGMQAWYEWLRVHARLPVPA